MNPEVLAIVGGTSGVIGLLSLISYFYYLYRVREVESSERSVKEIVEGDGLFNPDQVLQILREFKDDASRLNALKALTSLSNKSAERVYEKIKGNVDIGSLESQRNGTVRTLSIVTAIFFLAIALVALAYSLHPAPVPVPVPSKVLGDLEIPSDIAKQFPDLITQPDAGLVRLQPPSSDRMVQAQREALYHGGGSFYSFIRRTPDNGQGADIAYKDGTLSVGFAGLDYGFFLYLGQQKSDVLMALHEQPPAWLPGDHAEAWSYVWNYRPPNTAKALRAEKKRTRGFTVAGVNLSDGVTPTVGGVYLLRSLNVEKSDILVAIAHVATLKDNSVVLAYRVLSHFDTPVVVNRDE
ncbi:MAG: hypothetical protein WAL80_10155 [Xanthobacteraceae bacterium]